MGQNKERAKKGKMKVNREVGDKRQTKGKRATTKNTHKKRKVNREVGDESQQKQKKMRYSTVVQ